MPINRYFALAYLLPLCLGGWEIRKEFVAHCSKVEVWLGVNLFACLSLYKEATRHVWAPHRPSFPYWSGERKKNQTKMAAVETCSRGIFPAGSLLEKRSPKYSWIHHSGTEETALLWKIQGIAPSSATMEMICVAKNSMCHDVSKYSRFW